MPNKIFNYIIIVNIFLLNFNNFYEKIYVMYKLHVYEKYNENRMEMISHYQIYRLHPGIVHKTNNISLSANNISPI